MRILVISDVHSNLTALEAVLWDAGKVDQVWCLGDLIGYGPDPNEVIECIRNLPGLVCLMGNHDAAVVGDVENDAFNYDARQSILWTCSAISSESMAFLQSLSVVRVVEGITLAHGSPRSPIWEYILDQATAEINMQFMQTDYGIIGHSHVPVMYQNGHGRDLPDLTLLKHAQKVKLHKDTLINPGSVGQPRDQNPLASYAILELESMTWESRRVDYDVPGVQKRIIKAGLPKRHASRLSEGY